MTEMKATPPRYKALRAAADAAGEDIDRLTLLPRHHRYPGWRDDLNDAVSRYERCTACLIRFGFALAREKRTASKALKTYDDAQPRAGDA